MDSQEENKKHFEKKLKIIKKIAGMYPVFPVENKIPKIKNWYNEATQDPKQIDKWWSKWKNADMGIPMGERSGIWALDIDKKDGESGQNIMNKLPELPNTLVQTTPRGGAHYYFKYFKSFTFTGGTNVLGRLVDTRATGNFVVFYPSKGYKIHGKINRIAETPDWLLKRVIKKVNGKSNGKSIIKTLTYPQSSREEIRKVLRDLDIEKYRSRDDWRDIISGIKDGSHSEEYGFDELLTWSERDASYYDHDIEPVLRGIWDTMEVDKKGGITMATPVKAARKANVERSPAEFNKIVGAECVLITAAKKGRITGSELNLMNLLSAPRIQFEGMSNEMDNPYRGCLGYDELKAQEVYIHRPPWVSSPRFKSYEGEPIDEIEGLTLLCYLQQRYHVSNGSKGKVFDAMIQVAHHNSFNPLIEHLEGMGKWDGIPRLDTWLMDYAGSPDTPYVRMVGRKTLIAAVRRAFEPGCDFHNVLVLEGPQDVGKSKIVAILGGKYYGSPEISIGDKDAEQNIQGKWILEFSEMTVLSYKSGSMHDALKAYLTKNVNTYRPSYGKVAKDFPRRSIFIGTINPGPEDGWLGDPTGNKRFWPVQCRPMNGMRICNYIGLEKIRDQLWAEAREAYKVGEIHHLETDGQKELAEIEQVKRFISDPWVDTIRDYLEMGSGDELKAVTSSYLAEHAINIPLSKLDKRSVNRIATILKVQLKWKRGMGVVNGKRTNAFIRPKEVSEEVKKEIKKELNDLV